MIMRSASDIVLKLLGAILIVAAILKGWQLLTEPVANASIWTLRSFLIVQVECELALGIWLFSRLFKRAAWLVGLGCFIVFSAITLYKGITGAASCGCFGAVHVSPWITLFVVDLPAVAALALCRPREAWWPPCLPRVNHLGIAGTFLAVVLFVSGTVLALNEPERITSTYEVLEPETWVGKELPIIDYIDIGKQFTTGNWLVLFYHYDCPDCAEAIPVYEEMARRLIGNETLLRLSLIEIPPYNTKVAHADSSCALGRLADIKKWFITTPVVVLLTDGHVRDICEGNVPDFPLILESLSASAVENEMLVYKHD